MAYRRKQGAADDRRASYPQARIPLPRLIVFALLVGFLLAYRYHFLIDDSEDTTSSYGYTSFKSIDEPKLGLWQTLASKAKGIIDEDALAHKFEDFRKERPRSNSSADQAPQSRWSFENHWKTGEAAARIRPEALSASVNQLSGRIKNAFEVANAMAAKAKLLLRELKSIKADLAFAKQRCAQLEEENKLLRETKQKGSKTEEDDDLIRLQLETLLAEKSRLAQENSTYARENRFLREIVDFHQFSTTQDVVSLGDGDMEDDGPDEESNLLYTENMVPVVEENSGDEELSPVPSRPESPVIRPGEASSPMSTNSQNPSASDTA
nr:unnamed protein product [Digitaria exilis]